jgi:hypothetical protein
MDEIGTEPTRSDWLSLVFMVFPMFTGFVAVIPMICIGYFYLDTPTCMPPMSVKVACFIFGAMVSFLFVRRELNRKYWLLTESELISGRWNSKRIPLSSIKKVIVGLPNLLGKASKLTSPAIGELAAHANMSALLIILDDERLLTLKLSFLDEGPFLTQELVKRLSNRVVWNHQYTEEEIRLLRRVADPNALSTKQSLKGLF